MKTIVPCLLLLLSACAELDEITEELDGETDSLADGDKADIGTLAENTPDAYVVLQVANTASKATLVDKVRLGRVAAGNIIATRLGDDGRWKTRDDVRFKNLAELDRVAYIGPQAFARLRDWGKRNDQGMPDLYGTYRVAVKAEGSLIELVLKAEMKPSGEFVSSLESTSGERLLVFYNDARPKTVVLVGGVPGDPIAIPGSVDRLDWLDLEGPIRSGDSLCGTGWAGLNLYGEKEVEVIWSAVRVKGPGQTPMPTPGCQ